MAVTALYMLKAIWAIYGFASNIVAKASDFQAINSFKNRGTYYYIPVNDY